MRRGAAFDRSLLPALLGFALLTGTAAALLAWARHDGAVAARELSAALGERASVNARIAQAQRQAEAAREVAGLRSELVARGLIGAERRLEWTETLARSREARQIAELHYEIAPRRPLWPAGAAASRATSFASALKFRAAVLHEGDLFGLLEDLRRSGSAWQAPRRCAVQRIATAGTSPTAPRLLAECEIDLITIDLGERRS